MAKYIGSSPSITNFGASGIFSVNQIVEQINESVWPAAGTISADYLVIGGGGGGGCDNAGGGGAGGLVWDKDKLLNIGSTINIQAFK